MALPLVVTAGVAEGLWEGRWAASEDLQRATARLGEVPLAVGDWQGQAEELDPAQVERAEFTGYLLRRYVHRRTKWCVSVLVACGRPGPLSLHTPEVCYPGSGYEAVGPAESGTVLVPGLAEPVELKSIRFRQPGGPYARQLNVCWSWSATGAWRTPEHPRLTFAREAALYKMYVISPEAGTSRGQQAGSEFLKAFLPDLNRHLFPDRPAGAAP
jgi:hypothetical protein